MTRVKRGNVARKRRKQVLKLAQGFRGSSSKLFRTAQQRTMKALSYSYQDRQKKKTTICWSLGFSFKCSCTCSWYKL